MPVKKVHVKGKRKAPLPPTIIPNLLPNSPESRQTENDIGEILCANESQYSICHKRKKAALLPPPHKNDHKNNELNNFSMFSDKFDEKINNESINLNIFEPLQIRNDLQNATKQNNDAKRDQVAETLNFTARNKGDDQVWICNSCTLRNPFWKIVCDACERIKPYNTPNLPMSRAMDANYNKDIPQIDNVNVLGPVKIRTKALNVNRDPENGFKRSSMIQHSITENANMQLKPREQKVVNRPISVCFPPTDKTLNTAESLEMEKDRIRALIRAMNNRALAQNYSGYTEKPVNIVQNQPKNGAIKRLGNQDEGKQKNHQKYDIEKNYNFPTREYKNFDNYLSQTDDSKASATLKKAEQAMIPKNQVSTNFFDQTILGNTTKAPEQKLNSPVVIRNMKKEPDFGGNRITISLYVNFNKAVEAKVHHRMTLAEFKNYILRNVTPSKCPKIYFNGMLLRGDEQMLVSYGVKDRSSLYINTENVVAHPRTDITSPIKSYEKLKEVEPMKDAIKVHELTDIAIRQPREIEVDDTKMAGEKYLIEHIQVDRYTIEKINPEPVNLSKTKYRGVYNYNPRCNPDLPKILNKKVETIKNPIVHTVKQTELKVSEQPSICDTVNQYMELLSLDDSMNLTKNTEAFECSICLVDYQPLEGVILRNCLHTFCADCVRNSIIYSDEAEVKCPYIDKDYSCEYFLQDREIKALLSKSEFDEHLAKSLRISENQIENSFHCRTPNCKGWCIYEDDVNVFKCPICSLGNCLTCRVIHDGLDCKQYQTMMQNNADSNPENATTVKLLEEMVKNGEAMNCPTCRIVLMKKWGCDWLKCSMCKTEICWITRGPRWGSNMLHSV